MKRTRRRSQHLPRREFNSPGPFNHQPTMEAAPPGRCERTLTFAQDAESPLSVGLSPPARFLRWRPTRYFPASDEVSGLGLQLFPCLGDSTRRRDVSQLLIRLPRRDAGLDVPVSAELWNPRSEGSPVKVSLPRSKSMANKASHPTLTALESRLQAESWGAVIVGGFERSIQ